MDEAFKIIEKIYFANECVDVDVRDKVRDKLETKTNKRGGLKDYEYIGDVEIYNRLMFELARTGKTSKIYLLFKKMRSPTLPESKRVDPNLNSYAAAFQSFGYQFHHRDASNGKKVVAMDETTSKNSQGMEKSIKINQIKLSVERIIWDLKKSNVNNF
jgi:hypothetical protein